MIRRFVLDGDRQPVRPVRTAIDPRTKRLDFTAGEPLAPRRHDDAGVVLPGDVLYEATVGAVSRRHDGAMVATTRKELCGMKSEPTFFLITVTRDTALFEDGQNVPGEGGLG